MGIPRLAGVLMQLLHAGKFSNDHYDIEHVLLCLICEMEQGFACHQSLHPPPNVTCSVCLQETHCG